MNDIIRPEIKTAIALHYDGSSAPQVTARGEEDSAEKIIELAKAHNIPLCDNPALIDLLAEIDIGDRIPEPLYKAVAHVMAFAFALKGDAPPEASAHGVTTPAKPTTAAPKPHTHNPLSKP